MPLVMLYQGYRSAPARPIWGQDPNMLDSALPRPSRPAQRRVPHPSMPAQVIAVNAMLISAAVLAAAVAAQLDLQVGDERRRFYVLIAAILATVLVNALVVRRRFEPLEQLIDTMEQVDAAELRGRPAMPPRPDDGGHAPLPRLRRHARPARGGALANGRRRAARPGGRARADRARPPRRGQPGAHRRRPATSGHGAERAAGAARGTARDTRGRDPGDAGAAAASPASCGRPRSTTTASPRRCARRSRTSAGRPRSPPTSTSSRARSTSSAPSSRSSSTESSRRASRTWPRTPMQPQVHVSVTRDAGRHRRPHRGRGLRVRTRRPSPTRRTGCSACASAPHWPEARCASTRGPAPAPSLNCVSRRTSREHHHPDRRRPRRRARRAAPAARPPARDGGRRRGRRRRRRPRARARRAPRRRDPRRLDAAADRPAGRRARSRRTRPRSAC